MSPWAPLPPCRHPGCPNLQTRERNGFCEAHQAEAERRQHRGRYRGSAHARGYTEQYEHLRAMLLAREPLCQLCRQEGRVTLAEQVHHVKPLSQGGLNELSNLMPICREHHERLHASGGARASQHEPERADETASRFSGQDGRRPAGRPTRTPAGFPNSHLLESGVTLNAQ